MQKNRKNPLLGLFSFLGTLDEEAGLCSTYLIQSRWHSCEQWPRDSRWGAETCDSKYASREHKNGVNTDNDDRERKENVFRSEGVGVLSDH